MRIAIFSDVHANLEALQAVLDDFERTQPDTVVCLGDIVGYGANPSQCLNLVREHADIIVLGNHDEAAFDFSKLDEYTEVAQTSARWTAHALSEEEKRYLKSLPFKMTSDDLLFVHSTPRNPQDWEYILSAFEARLYESAFAERVCFIGHSHVPAVYHLSPNASHYSPNHRFIINVGSVGQPRDGNWRAAYGLLDTVAGSFEINRVEYDVRQASEKIIDAGLPRILGDRLFRGR